ncbi:BMP family protein [Arachnia propionica]|uniref:BMP family ABC transporter substrate-binding protein n=1 Tax=Arachnia propionica TaxID=1750 RepID=A0A3P1WXY0_9ACTN|nr:BMP family ABC transporter substrate-binding protein [Arachnia propionica]RRD51454.1 BMP family ABC transporter substrate-binding protein [Arachnia propionica]
MTKSLLKFATLAAAGALALTSCAQAPTSTPSGSTAASGSASASSSTGGGEAPTGDFKACMVSDFGGFDDKSFNETSYKGLQMAKEELGVQTAELESQAEADYAGNVAAMIDQKCNIVITVGFALAKATESAAKQNPESKFAIVDFGSFEGVDNAKGLTFNTAEPAFMAGYVAASLTQTGKVGTFGGANYPTVTIFMDGFAQGVAHYNKAKNANVEVLGWSHEAQDGQFIGGNDPFGDTTGGKNTANTLMSQGADIILPVAGPAGLGALAAVKESGGKVNAIWVDTDGYVSAPDYKDVIITSVEKAMDVAVFDAIKAAKDGSFSAEEYVGTLANGGVNLSEFHDFDSKVSAETKSELEAIKADIIAGKIVVELPKQQ